VTARRYPVTLTPSEACDLHIDYASWLHGAGPTALGDVRAFMELFAPNNEPYGWGPRTSPAEANAELAELVGTADTFYVTAEMQLIAAEAAVDLEGMPLFERDLPSRNMLVLLDGAAGWTHSDWAVPEARGGEAVSTSGRLSVTDPTEGLPRAGNGAIEVPVRGFLLTHRPNSIRLVDNGTPVPGPEGLVDGMAILTLLDVDSLITQMLALGELPQDAHQRRTDAPLTYGEFTGWPYGRTWETMTEEETSARFQEERFSTDRVGWNHGPQRRLLMSLLLLMAEERYTARERPERPTRRRWKAASLTVPDDYCVSVTRLRRPHRRVEPDPGTESKFSHQWVVRGHWRRIHKGTPDERAVWIAPYVKGPEGAPFVEKRKLTMLVT